MTPLGTALTALTGSALYQDGKLAYHLLTSPAKVGSALTWAQRIKGLGSFDKEAGLLEQGGALAKTLGPLGRALGPGGAVFSGVSTLWGSSSSGGSPSPPACSPSCPHPAPEVWSRARWASAWSSCCWVCSPCGWGAPAAVGARRRRLGSAARPGR